LTKARNSCVQTGIRISKPLQAAPVDVAYSVSLNGGKKRSGHDPVSGKLMDPGLHHGRAECDISFDSPWPFFPCLQDPALLMLSASQMERRELLQILTVRLAKSCQE
jgi:hypothetical protein